MAYTVLYFVFPFPLLITYLLTIVLIIRNCYMMTFMTEVYGCLTFRTLHNSTKLGCWCSANNQQKGRTNCYKVQIL